MKPAVVVDVGNTRVKWGRCADDRVAGMASLAHDDEDAWRRQMLDWQIPSGSTWAVSGVQPKQRDRIGAWLSAEGYNTQIVNSYWQLPLRIDVDYPDKVGLDRLLNAVAVNTVRSPEAGAFIVDAGTAVTVDYVDPTGTFKGGAIFPGLRLMAKALHDYTALLPLMDTFESTSEFPSRNTEDALRTGIVHAVAGAIGRLAASRRECELYLGGGDAAILFRHVTRQPLLNSQPLRVWPEMTTRVWPEMTLEGIRRSVQ